MASRPADGPAPLPDAVEEDSGRRVLTRTELQKLAAYAGLKEEVVALKEKLAAALHQLDVYERIIAKVEPEAVTRRAPKALKEYSDDLPDRILALGWTGMHVWEILGELGMTVDQWQQFRNTHPEFKSAADRATVLAASKFMRAARFAIETKDHKFPLAKIDKFIQMMEDGLGGEHEDQGDASELIRLDLSASGSPGVSE